jgi:hypothetical protein
MTNSKGQMMSTTTIHLPPILRGTFFRRGSFPACAIAIPLKIESMTLWKFRVVRPAAIDLRLLAWLFIAADRSRFKSGTKPRRRHALLCRRTFSENNDVVNETGHSSM